jgi:hypothetical protein
MALPGTRIETYVGNSAGWNIPFISIIYDNTVNRLVVSRIWMTSGHQRRDQSARRNRFGMASVVEYNPASNVKFSGNISFDLISKVTHRN